MMNSYLYPEDRNMNYSPPPPHPLPADADAFYASLSPIEKQLHLHAREKLGSCYFMEKTNGYLAWKAKQKSGK